MGVSINWLRDYVEFNWTPEEVAHNLTMAGIAIEGVEKQDGDSILELDLTPNRGDCLGLINLAREVAALNDTAVTIPEIHLKENNEDINSYIKVEIDDPDLCKRYTARMVKNVTVKPSPVWMQNKLIRSGVRPINNIVDITNYVMLETNQPLHAFDYDLLNEAKTIIVRRANTGEKLTTLDDVERELEDEMLLITDAGRGVALAGIMGGQNTEINTETTNVLIESAYFHGPNIRKTSRKLALRSDSSIRFEKGSDINGVIYALNRAAALMQELGDGEVVSGICDQYPEPQVPKQIILRPQRVNYLLGISLSPAEIKEYIQKLKFKTSEEAGDFLVYIPTYRPDIEFEADLIEEVARLYGYNNIPATLPAGSATQGGQTTYQLFRDRVKALMTRTFYEIINYSFISPSYFDMMLVSANSNLRNAIKVANPLSEEQSIMRTFLLPGLLNVVSRNLARKNDNLAFFEMGSVFDPGLDVLPTERLILGGIVAGKTETNWMSNQVEMDFYYLKGILESFLGEIGIDHVTYIEAQDPSYHPGRSAVIMVDDIRIGIIGEIHPLVRQNFDIKPRACAFEMDIDALFLLSKPRVMKEQITRYPAVERDLAIIVEGVTKAADAISIIRENGGDLIQNIVVFDVYSGEQVKEGYKSIAFRLTFQANDRTLTEFDVNSKIDNILSGLKDRLKAVLR